MKLVTFSHRGRTRIGALADEETVVDFSVAAPKLPVDMTAFIEAGAKGLSAARAALKSASKGVRLKRSRIALLAPIPLPRRNILCVGKNYYEHAHEFDKSGFNATAGSEAIPD